jgi:hypothetical protein
MQKEISNVQKILQSMTEIAANKPREQSQAFF